MKRSLMLSIALLSLTSTALIADQYDTNPYSGSSLTNPIANEQNDPIEIILLDHAQIRQMMSALENNLNSNLSESRAQFKTLQDFLVKHETMEQKAWYPALEKQEALKTIIADLKKEEENAAKALKEIDGIRDDKEWTAKVKGFMQAVEQHAKDEETKLFPKVKEMLDKPQLNALGQQLRDYRTKEGM